MSITLSLKASVRIPAVPNFFLLEDGQRIPISAIEDEGLKQIGMVWVEALRENARRQIKEAKASDEQRR